MTAILNDFNEPGTLAPTGMHLGGTKYMVIQGEPGVVIRGKKVINFAYNLTLITGFSTIICTGVRHISERAYLA